jgi:hypothetical protein
MGQLDEQLSALKDELKKCTASVLIDNRSKGTAFFINEAHLLTCEHVVIGRDTVDVHPFGRREARTARVVAREPVTGLDLALLQVEPEPDEEPYSCVLLDERLDDADYYVAGYPREEGQEAGLEVYRIQGHIREGNRGLPQQLQLEAGKQVTWGMSGGPVLSATSGVVVAVIRSSKDPTGAQGGGAIPIGKAADAFDEVRRALKDPPLAVRAWRDTLGKERWQRLGRIWQMHAQVDLNLRGARYKWYITTDPTGAPDQYISGRDLGDDVTEAMFLWAQRRRISTEEELNLLGRLLAGALFPASVVSRLNILGQADEILVRLHIAHDTGLADIPWELAAVPGQARRFLAADPRFRFVRVSDGMDLVDGGSTDAAQSQVLGVVGLPTRWIFPTVYGEQTYKWPSNDEIWRRLTESFSAKSLALQLMKDPEPYEVRKELESGNYDVLHYVGVGRIGKLGRAQLSLVDAVEGDVNWQDIGEMFDWASTGGVRLVVLEFTLPPADQVLEMATPSALGDMLQGSINAVVYTRFPVHPRQFQAFNRAFYEHLGDGDPVETAVQRARQVLEQNKSVEDSAGFGWFTLVTGPNPYLRLVPQRAGNRQQPSPKSPLEPLEPPPSGVAPEETTRVRDEFSR